MISIILSSRSFMHSSISPNLLLIPPSVLNFSYCILQLLLVLFFFLIYLFMFGCVGSLLLCAGFLKLSRVGATLRCGAWASHCGGFSCCRAGALGAWASVVVACGLNSCGSRDLECRLSNCGTRA